MYPIEIDVECFEQPAHDVQHVHEASHTPRIGLAEVVIREEYLGQVLGTLHRRPVQIASNTATDAFAESPTLGFHSRLRWIFLLPSGSGCGSSFDGELPLNASSAARIVLFMPSLTGRGL